MNAPATAEVVQFRNKSALNKFVKNHAGASPDALVKAINITLNLAVGADNELQHHRLEAGRMLKELRERVEADGHDWWKWQVGKFDRSRKDIEKLIRLANAEDPDVAIEDERAKQKIRDDRKPRLGAGPAPKSPPTADHVFKLVCAMTAKERAKLVAKIREQWPW